MEYASIVVPLLVLGLVLLLMSNSRRSSEAALNRRAAAVERRLDAISSQLRLAPPTEDHPGVLAELQQGRKVQAVKLYREESGADLADAKAAVEEIARQHGLPDQAGNPPLGYRLARIGRQVDALAAHHGLPVQAPPPAQVVDELRQGRKVQAIKLYRQETGADLLEAKNAVEEIARRQGL